MLAVDIHHSGGRASAYLQSSGRRTWRKQNQDTAIYRLGRQFYLAAVACFRTSLRTLPLAPVIRIKDVLLSNAASTQPRRQEHKRGG